MKNSQKIDRWQLALVPHNEVIGGFHAETVEALLSSGKTILNAEVPGNFELDLLRAGLIDDPYYGDNAIKMQKLEHLHLWYFTTFELKREAGKSPLLSFGGIDTASEIFLDGVKIGTTENMLIPHEFPLDGISDGVHELVVHIIPAAVYARQLDLPLSCRGQKYHSDSLVLRKAPYMYGWDIMPRILSAGLWKPVEIIHLPEHRISELYVDTYEVSTIKSETVPTYAKVRFSLRIDTVADLLTDFTYRIDGKCGDSSFHGEGTIFSTVSYTSITIQNPSFWMPKNYGDPNLYDVTVTLLRNGVVCDVQTLSVGIRIVELERSSLAGEDGEFCFRVNGVKIFVMGTNWVPTDAFPSRHDAFAPRALEMLDDIGCNMVRWWGGNVYPSDFFFDFCDRKGILVWQDFTMACGIYPNDSRMCDLIREEAVYIVRQFRNHASLALWSGDNECDETLLARTLRVNGKRIRSVDPNENRLTRSILHDVIREHDYARPYLPSSPYFDETVFRTNGAPSEAHLWGPRDFFKGKYYSTAPAHFASETGYHGCPSPESLKRYIPEESLNAYGNGSVCDDRAWLTHAACMEPVPKAPNAYRIPLMSRQVERIFGEIPTDLNRYALESQISQAEAKKYFIERFRISKWRRTGILWWNLIDGWPQISDAIVDHYGVKKLAYSYIKRSQQPFVMMIDEPKNGILTLYAANDMQTAQTVRYQLKDLSNGTTVLTGEFVADANTSVPIAKFPETKGAFYLIQWEGNVIGKNHYQASIGDKISLEAYLSALKHSGFASAFEGFNTTI